jgi:uncharacterized protein
MTFFRVLFEFASTIPMRTRSTALLVLAMVGIAVGLLSTTAHAQRYDFPPRPSGPVLDQGGLLSPTQEQQLDRKLTAFEDTTSTAIVVVTLQSLNGAPISDYAIELGRAWGVGQDEKDNGVVFLVSRDDRKMFIATGYGVEGALPDAVANRIVERIVTPAFREGQFYAGIDRGTDAIIQATKGEYDASQETRSRSSDDGIPTALIFTILILVYFVGRGFFRGGGKRGRKSRRRHGDSSVFIWGSGGGFSGGSGFSGGGGGFGGFGGGSFGGGGAGGSW